MSVQVQAYQDTEKTIQRFTQEKLMAVIRTDNTEDAIWGGRLLVEAGFQILDITYGTPNTETVIEKLASEFPSVIVGAGTVLKPSTALSALAAGAQFLASPILDLDMLQFGTDHQVLILPGVSTPTEMFNAMKSGAHMLKFFPAEPIGGAKYIKTVLAPLPNLPIIATGGIDERNMADYWRAGVTAVGVGTHLLPAEALKNRDQAFIMQRAKSYLAQRDALLS